MTRPSPCLGRWGQRFIVLGWIALMVGSTNARAADSFSQAISRFDFLGLVWAMGVSALGGTGRTVLSLGSRTVLVIDPLRRLITDVVSSLIAGAVAFALCLLVARITGWRIDYDLMIVLMFFGGWARDTWLSRVDGFSVKVVDRALDRAERALGIEPAKEGKPDA